MLENVVYRAAMAGDIKAAELWLRGNATDRYNPRQVAAAPVAQQTVITIVEDAAAPPTMPA